MEISTIIAPKIAPKVGVSSQLQGKSFQIFSYPINILERKFVPWFDLLRSFKNIGICMVFCYEGRGGVKNLRKSRYVLYGLSLSRISEKSENSHHAKIINYNAFSEFLQMVPKHNFIGPFKLFLFIG
jgi:hypothetical protein